MSSNEHRISFEGTNTPKLLESLKLSQSSNALGATNKPEEGTIAEPPMNETWDGIKQGMATGLVHPLHSLPSAETSASSFSTLHNNDNKGSEGLIDVPLTTSLSSSSSTASTLNSESKLFTEHFQPSSTTLLSSSSLSPFHSLSAKDASGNEINFASFIGKPVLVVNVALESALSSQFGSLQKLYDKHHKMGLEILGFPCNQFGEGSPGTALEIQNHCARTFGVTFPIMEKVDVEGDQTHPLFLYLKSQKKNMLLEGVKWNFEKFLIDGDGHVVERWSPLASIDSIEPHIVRLLALPPQPRSE